MALKAVQVMEVPSLRQVPETPSAAALLPRAAAAPGFVVLGHRGKGMNALESADLRMRAVKENSLLSFNRAALFPIDFVEFDVQVTKDDCPIIFHDDIILTEDAVRFGFPFIDVSGCLRRCIYRAIIWLRITAGQNLGEARHRSLLGRIPLLRSSTRARQGILVQTKIAARELLHA
ncbi:Glycerophosphodiester phosphodiesterase [Musa troglodytarum]|uniref:glycerophosphodiester phosphodiesterase n=1 Tax=Musa troglodytarum TaxID=320322 RepID=A0A9E7HGL8_9LILI|nr:Glycerophosphodiester phosphodiesterase [Musa troglodytarum]